MFVSLRLCPKSLLFSFIFPFFLSLSIEWKGSSAERLDECPHTVDARTFASLGSLVRMLRTDTLRRTTSRTARAARCEKINNGERALSTRHSIDNRSDKIEKKNKQRQQRINNTKCNWLRLLLHPEEIRWLMANDKRPKHCYTSMSLCFLCVFAVSSNRAFYALVFRCFACPFYLSYRMVFGCCCFVFFVCLSHFCFCALSITHSRIILFYISLSLSLASQCVVRITHLENWLKDSMRSFTLSDTFTVLFAVLQCFAYCLYVFYFCFGGVH